ncbi:MAG: hypothetical protein QOI24_3217 [Acidobacteriota bacterium]|jgi:hypothetical protein|nr:hypothetical protein [Acidobacteriota bacterium]
MRLTRSLVVALLALSAAGSLYAQCGVERWTIKTGTDSGASSINLSSWVSSTIYNMQQSAHPASLPATTRIAPRETTQYSLSGTLTKYVKEGDSDYHLVIQDSAGRTMIVEIPAPNCVGAGSPFGTRISNARSQFDAKFTATTSFKSTSTAVTVRGIGFWDFLHGQTGTAPNGIEIHPVLNITFGGAASIDGGEETAPVDDPANAVKYPADVVADEDGGRVRVFRGGEILGDALFHGGAVVEAPSVNVIFVGNNFSDEETRTVMHSVRGINADSRFQELSRYGVRTFGMHVNSRNIADAGREITDLGIQRALSNAVEAGSIQHVDENTLYVVVLDRDTDASLATNRDWLSYHSQFHPTELPMNYVVVRGGLDPEHLREAITASVFRALVNPAGNGWF